MHSMQMMDNNVRLYVSCDCCTNY